MAIIELCPGISVYVRVGNQRASEYADPDIQEMPDLDIPTHRCYIESVTGSQFSIEAVITHEHKIGGYYDFAAIKVLLDGEKVRYTYFENPEPSWGSSGTLVISSTMEPSKNPDENVARKFVFGSVSTVEDTSKERILHDRDIAKTLGRIEVQLWYGASNGKSQDPPEALHNKTSFQLAEKSIKGREISHGSTFSAEEKFIKATKTLCVTRSREVCRFIFNYRSRDVLKRALILPSIPLPEPNDPEIGHLSPEEIRNLARKMVRMQKGERKILKREADDDDDTVTKVPARPFKMIRLDNGKEAVDLAGDDD